MNFEFSPEQVELRASARRFLAKHCPPTAVRAVLDGAAPYDAALWAGLADMGFLRCGIPETYGGLGLGYLELCVLAEEMGRVLAPVPFSSSLYLAAGLLLAAGSEAQKQHWLPKLAAGGVIGTLALAEQPGAVTQDSILARLEDGHLTGAKYPVPDGGVADFVIIAAQTPKGVTLALVDLHQPGVTREALDVLDPTRPHARLTFAGAQAALLSQPGEGWALIQHALDEAAVLFAFEQLGGADRALDMARDYALERMAFGRPIGSFQAIKHRLADMYVATTLARSNAYYGAWALSCGATELPLAAAAARISATEAFQHCARENHQIHGGMGFTWESDCHLFYRRANQLALGLGPIAAWEDQLIAQLQTRGMPGAPG